MVKKSIVCPTCNPKPFQESIIDSKKKNESSDSVFFKGLSHFKNRILYGNIYNDLTVQFPTSILLPSNPFIDRASKKWKPVIRHPEFQNMVIFDFEEHVKTVEVVSTTTTSTTVYDTGDTPMSANSVTDTIVQRHLITTTSTTITPTAETTASVTTATDAKANNTYFANDPKRNHLTSILRNLNRLTWTRYGVASSKWLLAHEEMLGRRAFMSDGVAKHLVHHFQH